MHAPKPRAAPVRHETGGSSVVVFEPTGGEGKRFEMGAAATRVTVGRKADNSIQLIHRGVSGKHAELRWVDGRVWLTDNQSTNGTFVNDQQINEIELHSGDVLRFDAVAFRVVYGAGAPPQRASQPVVEHLQDRTMMLSDEELASLADAKEEDPVVADDFEAPEPEIELAHMHCMRHKTRIAQQSCDVCNRPYCSECLSSVLNEQVCFRCRTQGTEQ